MPLDLPPPLYIPSAPAIHRPGPDDIARFGIGHNGAPSLNQRVQQGMFAVSHLTGFNRRRASAAAWSPLDLGAGLIQWIDFTDKSQLFQDTAGTTPVTATSQSIKRAQDKSGNGYHMTEATDAPVYGEGSGRAYVEFSGAVTQRLFSTPTVTGLTSCSVFWAQEITSGQTLIFNNSAATVYAALGISGGGGSAHSAGLTPTYYKNGAVVTGTTGAIYTALSGAAAHYFEIRALNLTGFAQIGMISSSPYLVARKLGHQIICTTTAADANRTEIVNFLTSDWGL